MSVVVHEVSHGAVANALGDRTAKDLGRLTLNPLKHLDPFGSVILPLLLSFTGFIFGYAKPVPYNPANLRDRRYGPAMVGLAGPFANIALAILFGLVLRVLPVGLAGSLLPQLLAIIVIVNLALAFFNLIPVPPLDGHWLLMAFLPARAYGLKVFLYKNSILMLVLAIFIIFPLLMPLIRGSFSLIVGQGLGGF
jgi:Zn-dependent protease